MPSTAERLSAFSSHGARVLLDDFSLMPTRAAHVWHPEVVEAARRVESNVIRWPGGYFASFYDWRYADG